MLFYILFMNIWWFMTTPRVFTQVQLNWISTLGLLASMHLDFLAEIASVSITVKCFLYRNVVSFQCYFPAYLRTVHLLLSVCTSSMFVTSNKMQNLLGNHIASYVRPCHTRIVDFATQLSFNFENFGGPITLYTYPNTIWSNSSVYVKIVDRSRTKSIPVGRQKMTSFNCMLTLISFFGTSVYYSNISINFKKVLTASNAFSYRKSMLRQMMPEYFVVFNVLDQSLGSIDSQGSQDLSESVVLKLFGKLYMEHLSPLFTFPTTPHPNLSPFKIFLFCCSVPNE